MMTMPSRRDFLTSLTAAGAAGLFGGPPAFAGEGSPETTTIHLLRDLSCGAPTTLAAELMRAEGFSDVRYADYEAGDTDMKMLLQGRTDIGVAFVTDVVRELDAGTPITVLGGMHPGCHELFVHDPVHSIRDLKGRSVALPDPDNSVRLNLSMLLAYIGLDPNEDIDWVKSATPMELFAEGKADAFFGFPPQTQELRARKIGRVIFKTATERPWSQYFCCVLLSRREYVESHPVATKRALRAILKATDMCAVEPERAARWLVEGVSTPTYDQALEMMRDLPYGAWREYDPEDTLRFYALRLRELDLIEASPNQLIAEGADWRFLNELKRELKA